MGLNRTETVLSEVQKAVMQAIARCRNCGIPIDTQQGFSKHFCTDQCKTEFIHGSLAMPE
jgi:hypothetical protein